MKTPALRNILIAVAVLAVLAGLTFALTRPKPIAVTVAAVETGKVETTVANTRAGSVTACRRAKLAPPLGGRIDKLLVREGDRVKAGQVLVELWNDDLSARERISVEQLQSARARVNEACLVAETARRNAERTRALRVKGFVSEERVDQAESEAKARQAGCDSARAQVQEAGPASAPRAPTPRAPWSRRPSTASSPR